MNKDTWLYVLDKHGEPRPVSSILKWGAWFERADTTLARTVARTEVVPGIEVSTVFLGINHNFWGDGPPILWETMIFASEKYLEAVAGDGRQWRYDSKEKALVGHEWACAWVRLRLETYPEEPED